MAVVIPGEYSGRGHSGGIKWPGNDFAQPPSSGTESKEKVELYIYSPSCLL